MNFLDQTELTEISLALNAIRLLIALARGIAFLRRRRNGQAGQSGQTAQSDQTEAAHPDRDGARGD